MTASIHGKPVGFFPEDGEEHNFASAAAAIEEGRRSTLADHEENMRALSAAKKEMEEDIRSASSAGGEGGEGGDEGVNASMVVPT